MTTKRSTVQLNLPATLLSNSAQGDGVLRSSEHGDEATRVASELFDLACAAARLQSKEIAAICGVSRSLADKWRSVDARECPSLAQLLKLPITFQLALHRAMNQR